MVAQAVLAGPGVQTALSTGPEARLTPELRAAAVQAVQTGMRRREALVAMGIPAGTAGLWLAAGEGRIKEWHPGGEPITEGATAFLRALCLDFARAEAERERRTLEMVAKAAESVNEKTGIPEWRAGAWLLEHAPAYKKDYAEYREVRVQQAGTVSHEHRLVRELDDAQLLELAPEDWRELVPISDGGADGGAS